MGNEGRELEMENVRIAAFNQLSLIISDTLSANEKGSEELAQQIENEQIYNSWFVPFFVKKALAEIANCLREEHLKKWLLPYQNLMKNQQNPYRIGVITAGNIPLVGFHDFLSVLISGHVFVGKLSSNDNRLLPVLAKILCEIEPQFAAKIEFCQDKLNPIDKLIVTGGNHTAQHFARYFQQYPLLIRRHCNSAAVLDGNESAEELLALADDIMLYFGLGCRNISKLYVPKNYHFEPLFTALNAYKDICNAHHKYLNNLEYQKVTHLINGISFLDQGICLFKENMALDSPVSVVHYEYYTEKEEVIKTLSQLGENLQCTVSNICDFPACFPLGQSQRPKLNDYANNLDTVRFAATYLRPSRQNNLPCL
ncbi:MAG: hypothetical protein FWH36_02010 [Lentimicrobiaceae bacterium]|nr:hypothetical protein [Lentimicrobiaceae bacterium]